jgi:hypothetical protein
MHYAQPEVAVARFGCVRKGEKRIFIRAPVPSSSLYDLIELGSGYTRPIHAKEDGRPRTVSKSSTIVSVPAREDAVGADFLTPRVCVRTLVPLA